MSKETGPIKRSEELAPLSREHHEGLLLGWKIKQGLKNGTDIRTISAYVQWFWEHHLEDHFRKEEQVFGAILPREHALVERMFEEHESIEALFHINANIPDEALLLHLADTIGLHIRFEERELFPFAENTLDAEQLQEISRQLSQEKSPPSPWKEPFWTTK